MPETIAVRVADCGCPDTPHADDGHLVYLRAKLSLECGTQAQLDLNAHRDDINALLRAWTDTFVRYGVTGTNWMEPFDIDAIIEDYDLSNPVAEKANELYQESLLRPLGVSRPNSSSGGRTAPSTSRTRKSRATSPE